MTDTIERAIKIAAAVFFPECGPLGLGECTAGSPCSDCLAGTQRIIAAYEAALWQPIETVEDDGSLFDVWTTEGQRIPDCSFADFGQHGRQLCQPAEGGGHSYLHREFVTHWRPRSAGPG